MEEKRDDRRVRRTKAQLRAALIELMREKAPDEITVTELADRADVNRGTFYCHYRDIYDMLAQWEAEILSGFTSLMDSYSALQLRKGLRPILEDIFCFVQKNLDLAVAARGLWPRSNFLERLKEALRDKVTRDWSGLYRFTDDAQRDRCLNFLVGGVVSLIQNWIESGGQETPAEMAALAEGLILYGIQPMGAQ